MKRREVLRATGALALPGCAASIKVSSGPPAPAASGAPSPAEPAARRAQLYRLMGDLPARDRPIAARLLSTEDRPGYRLEHWMLDLNGAQEVPALVARPKGATGRTPAVLFNHSHGGGYDIGKREFVEGRKYLQPEPYAQTLTALGYTAVCIDHWCFGARAVRTENDTVKEMLWRGQTLWGHMVYDSLRAMDWLCARPDIDAARVATLGISMGSTMAWWLAALDTRVKVTIDLCCLTDFDALIASGGLKGHGFYYFVPSLLKHFSTTQINALIAPRAHLAIAGLRDPLTPVAGLDRIEAELTRVYTGLGHPDAWRLLRYDVPHQETPEGRLAVVDFLRTRL